MYATRSSIIGRQKDHVLDGLAPPGGDNGAVTTPAKGTGTSPAGIRRLSALVWALWASSVAFAAVAAVFTYLDVRFVPGYQILEEAGILIALTYGTVGAFIASRRPQNRVGWFLLGIGFLAGLNAVCTSYLAYGYTLHPELPLLPLAAWLHGCLIALLVPGTYLVFMIFPNGSLPSTRWRIPLGVVITIVVALVAIAVVAPRIYPNVLPSLSVANPTGIAGLPLSAGLTWQPALPFRLLGIIVCLSAIPVRLRHSGGVERQQLKYLAYIAILMIMGFAVGLVASLVGVDDAHVILPLTVLTGLAIGIPAACGLAILRYRLYDIDLLINRTLVYGGVTAVLVVVFGIANVASQRILEAVIGQRSELLTVLLVGGAALAFGPLRSRVRPIVDRFLPARAVLTLLFTDIVGSTRAAVELGDERWRSLLGRYRASVRRELARFSGHEVDTAGDGFFATFDRPAAGLRCAWAIRSAVKQLGLDTRTGLHVGECEMRGEKVSGLAVHAAARVMAAAGDGEILISGAVREASSGVHPQLGDRGRHELKGVPGEWQLFVVEAPPVVD
jgi:class 3 adenylate cyclase